MATWVLLRGLVRESGHWGAFISYFVQALPEAEVHVLDLPGNGALNALHSPTNIHGMVASCRQQLKAAGVSGPYAMLALSMGAMVAVQWADSYPDEVGRLVLVNTSMRPFNPFYRRLQPRNWGPMVSLLLRQFVGTANGQQWEVLVMRLTTNFSHPGVVSQWQALREAHPVTTRNALRQLWAAARFCAPANRPVVRTLLLASTQDQLVSVQCSRAIAQSWQIPLIEHSQAGHDLALDAPQWLVAQVRNWTLE
jgi:pimeloyl-ACP methyl ester carboxylesterase